MMARNASLLFLALISNSAYSDEQQSKGITQWLSWPVTGYPLSGPDLGMLIPSAEHGFEANAHKSVIIGLRSDGTVVWKFVDKAKDIPGPSSEKPAPDD